MVTTIGFGDLRPDFEHMKKKMEDSDFALFVDAIIEIFLFMLTLSMMAAFINALSSVGDSDSGKNKRRQREGKKMKKTKPSLIKHSKMDSEEADPDHEDPNFIAVKNFWI